MNLLEEIRKGDFKTAGYSNKVARDFFFHQYSINQKTIAKYEEKEGTRATEPIDLKISTDKFLVLPFYKEQASEFINTLQFILEEIIKKVYYLTPERARIDWDYKAEKEPQWVGSHGEDTIAILGKLMNNQ